MSADKDGPHGEGCGCEPYSLELGRLTIIWGITEDGTQSSTFHLDDGAQELRLGQLVSALEMAKFQIQLGAMVMDGDDD